MRIRGEERERNASMGQPRFELGSRAPKARRIPGYPTAPCAVFCSVPPLGLLPFAFPHNNLKDMPE